MLALPPAAALSASLFALLVPLATSGAFLAAAEQGPDASALEALRRGLTPRRLLAEYALTLALALAWLAQLFGAAGAGAGAAAASWPLWARALCGASALYQALLAKTVGDAAEPRASFAATQLPELRLPRFSHFALRLRARMAPLRAWWRAAGAAHAALVLAPRVPASCSAAPLLRRAAALAAAAADEALALAGAGGARAALASSGAGSFAECAAALAEARRAQPAVGVASWLVALTLDLAPLLLALLAAFSLCRCRAADFSGRETPAQAAWLWPVGAPGEVEGQAAPDRVLSATALRPRREACRLMARGLLGDSDGDGDGGGSSGASADAGAGADASADADAAEAERALAAAARALERQPALLRPLRVVILTVGTRGDVQPFVALGAHLLESGHSVCIATSANFRELIVRAGIEFHDIGSGQIEQPASWMRVRSTADMIRVTAPALLRDYRGVADAFREAVLTPRRADVVVGTGHTMTFALNLSEGLGMPCWVAKLAPELLSAGAPMPGGGRTSSWGLLNLARGVLYWLGVARAVGSAGISEAEDAWRRESLGLGPVQTAARLDELDFTPQLLCVSRLLFPKPLDYPRHAFQVGFLQTDGGDSQGLAQHEDDLSESEGSPPHSAAAAATTGTPAQRQRDAAAAAAAATPSSGSPGGGPPSNGAGAMPSPPLTPAAVARHRVVGGNGGGGGSGGGGGGGGGSRRIAHELRAFMDRPDPELRRRLPLAVVTFGSMTNSQRPRLVRDIVRVLYERGMRVLVLAGWRDCAATRAEVASLALVGGDEMPAAPEAAAAAGGSPGRAAAAGGGGGSELNGRVFVWDEAPHEYVFPNGLFVVHHGGAGTTARALSCGVPSVVIPVLRWADQSLYGELVERLGVGVLVREEGAPLAAIRRAVEAVLAGPRAGEPRVAHNSGSVMGDLANRVGSLVRAERAADTALALLESCLCRAVLGAAEAEQIRPRLAGAGARGAALRPLPEWAALSKAQRMCVRHCVVCRRVRAEACVADVGAASDGAAALAAAAAAAVASPAAFPAAAAPAGAGATPGFASPPQGAAAIELAGATPAAVRRRRKGSA